MGGLFSLIYPKLSKITRTFSTNQRPVCYKYILLYCIAAVMH